MDLSRRPISVESKDPNFRRELIIEICRDMGMETYLNNVYDPITGLIFCIGAYGDIVGINEKKHIIASIHKYVTQNKFKDALEVKTPESIFIPFNVSDEAKLEYLNECKSYAKNPNGESLVKPNSLSLSKGVKFCKNHEEVLDAVNSVWSNYRSDILVQEYVNGVVYRVVSYNGNVEIVFDHNTERPCNDDHILKIIQRCNDEISEKCNLNFYGADLIISKRGVYFLEVNDLPHINHLNRFEKNFDRKLYSKMISDIRDGKLDLTV